jgi:hypothetical protein
MPSFGRDIFANDPFLSDHGFGRADEMMNKMRKEMKMAMQMPMK